MENIPEKLLPVFNRCRAMNGFEHIAALMEKRGVRIECIDNPDNNSGIQDGHFSTTITTTGIIDPTIVINVAKPVSKLTRVFIHECTHAGQFYFEHILDYPVRHSLETMLCADIFSEVHATSNEIELPLKNYFRLVYQNDPKHQGCMDILETFYEKNQMRINKYLIAYMNGLLKGTTTKTIKPQATLRGALEHCRRQATVNGQIPDKRLVNGRKAILRTFFEPIPGSYQANEPSIDDLTLKKLIFFEQLLDNNLLKSTKTIQLKTVATMFTVSNEPFLHPEDYKEMLGAKGVVGIAKKILKWSPHKDFFSHLKCRQSSLSAYTHS